MYTEWSIGFAVHPYQIRYHVHAFARTKLADDPGTNYDGKCQMFRVNYGSDDRPDYDIICRGRCKKGGVCSVKVTRLRSGGARFSKSDYKWECVCKARKKRRGSE